jgi:hypothetical protein
VRVLGPDYRVTELGRDALGQVVRERHEAGGKSYMGGASGTRGECYPEPERCGPGCRSEREGVR